jgi:hypothetical protein
MKTAQQLFDANKNFDILVYTPHIIILKNTQDREVTFSKDGRMLVKNTLNVEEATVLAHDVLETASKAIKSE